MQAGRKSVIVIKTDGKARRLHMKIMAIDYGDARTGVAVSDALG